MWGRRSGLWSAVYETDLKNLNEMQKKLEDCAYLRAAVERDDWRAAKNHVEHFPVRTPENAQRFYQAPPTPEDAMTFQTNTEKRREMERRDMKGREIVTGGSKRRRQSRKRLSKKARARNVKKTNRKLKKRGKTHRKR